MKKIIENLKRNYYARKIYKAIIYVTNVTKEPLAIIRGNEYECYIRKDYLGKNFENIRQELWLAQIMKNKYKLRYLRCEECDVDTYYKVTFYRK